MTQLKLYFHSPCFDGIASAAITAEYLQDGMGASIGELRPMDYRQQANWLDHRLEQPSAVVDYLFHPDATFWADHHATSFRSEAALRAFEAKREERRFLYDRSEPSCAGMLWRTPFVRVHLQARFEEFVKWADKIDSASYSNPEEAMSSEVPAIRINRGLALATHADTCALVHKFRAFSLEAIASDATVRERTERFDSLSRAGCERVKTSLRLFDNIVTFDVDGEDVVIDRYTAYVFEPKARYSIGVVHNGAAAKLTVMRNPWLDFAGVNLGKICTRYGGGGHVRVAGVELVGEQASQAGEIARALAKDIVRAEGVGER